MAIHHEDTQHMSAPDDLSFGSKSPYEVGEQFFKLRDYTPIPLIILAFAVQSPTVLSATLGTICVVLGEWIRLYSVAFIGSISRTRRSSLGQQLVTTGPFGVVRNPLYVGNFLIVCGFTVFTAKFWMVLLGIILFSIQYVFIVQYEEQLLSERFGQSYEDYKRRVPAWLPVSLPRWDAIEWPQSFSEACISEKRTLTTILILLLLMSLWA
jgi:protein-S-isoprenylcysteine O-methyltransferase Ste14